MALLAYLFECVLSDGTSIKQTHEDVSSTNPASSTDGGFEIVNSMKRTDITLMQTPENSGPSLARNLAISEIMHDHRTGKEYDYVAFLDADDKWNSHHLQKSIDWLESLESCDVVCSIPYFVNEEGDNMQPVGIPYWQVPSIPNMRKSNGMYISTVIMKIETLFAIGTFDPDLDGIEDWDYWMRVLESGRTIKMISGDCSAVYTVREGGMASKVTPHQLDIFKHKHSKHTDFKLNLGCGDERLPGYLNVDLYDKTADAQFDVADIPYEEGTVDVIRAYHIIEHFTFNTAFEVLRKWHAALKPGGLLMLETPDMLNSCKAFVAGDEQERIKLYGHFFAWPDLSTGQIHYFLYTENQLRWTLEQCGFTDIRRNHPDSTYATANHGQPEIYLNVTARKPL